MERFGHVFIVTVDGSTRMFGSLEDLREFLDDPDSPLQDEHSERSQESHRRAHGRMRGADLYAHPGKRQPLSGGSI